MAKKSQTSQGNSLPDHAAPDASDPNATELFFGNLPRSATVESLYTLCAHYAPVRSVVLKPPRGDDGASRGPIARGRAAGAAVSAGRLDERNSAALR